MAWRTHGQASHHLCSTPYVNACSVTPDNARMQCDHTLFARRGNSWTTLLPLPARHAGVGAPPRSPPPLPLPHRVMQHTETRLPLQHRQQLRRNVGGTLHSAAQRKKDGSEQADVTPFRDTQADPHRNRTPHTDRRRQAHRQTRTPTDAKHTARPRTDRRHTPTDPAHRQGQDTRQGHMKWDSLEPKAVERPRPPVVRYLLHARIRHVAHSHLQQANKQHS